MVKDGREKHKLAAKRSLWGCFGRRRRDGRSLGRSGVGKGCIRVGEKILRGEGEEIWNRDLPAWLESAWRTVLETQGRTGQSWGSEGWQGLVTSTGTSE